MDMHAPPPPPPRACFVGLACIDVINSVASYPAEDACTRATSQRRARGGNASNSAVVAAACGIEAAWRGTLPRRGSADAHFVLKDLKEAGVAAAPVHRDDCDAAPTSYVTVSEATGSRTIVHVRGDLDELRPGEAAWSGASWVHFEGRAGAVAATTAGLEALRGTAVRTSVELEKLDAVLDPLEALADVVFYSRERAERDGYDDPAEFLRDKAAAASKAGRTQYLTCAWGAEGACAARVRGRAVTVLRCGVLPGVTAVDTVGAGDAFNGAFVAALLRGEPAAYERKVGDLGHALRVACCVAGRKVARVGFRGLAYPDSADVDRIELRVVDEAIIDRAERCLRAAVERTGAAVSEAQMEAMSNFMKTAEVDDGGEASRAAKLEQLESAGKEELEAMFALFGAAGPADKPRKYRPGPADPSVARLKGLAEECRLLFQPIESEAARGTLEASTKVWDAVAAWVDAGEAELGTVPHVPAAFNPRLVVYQMALQNGFDGTGNGDIDGLCGTSWGLESDDEAEPADSPFARCQATLKALEARSEALGGLLAELERPERKTFEYIMAAVDMDAELRPWSVGTPPESSDEDR